MTCAGKWGRGVGRGGGGDHDGFTTNHASSLNVSNGARDRKKICLGGFH